MDKLKLIEAILGCSNTTVSSDFPHKVGDAVFIRTEQK